MLILVVALLVLMALIGTAFIVTARTDRTAARLHTHNAQADMAVQSAVNLVVAELSADLFAHRARRSSNSPGTIARPLWEAERSGQGSRIGTQSADAMIGPRVPVLPNPTAAPTRSTRPRPRPAFPVRFWRRESARLGERQPHAVTTGQSGAGLVGGRAVGYDRGTRRPPVATSATTSGHASRSTATESRWT